MPYTFLNSFFFVFHSGIVLFILTGWIWRKTRRIHLILLILTAFSWFVLGIWYGFGYCPCTDWHWQVRAKLGHWDMPSSYLVFLIQKITGLEIAQPVMDVVAVSVLLICFALSLFLNARELKNRRVKKSR
jgi:hypothetical protein